MDGSLPFAAGWRFDPRLTAMFTEDVRLNNCSISMSVSQRFSYQSLHYLSILKALKKKKTLFKCVGVLICLFKQVQFAM